MTAPVSIVPRAQGFNCPSCGAAIASRATGWAVTVVCASCGALLDATDPLLRILQRGERVSTRPRIPLGTRGTWKGHPWEVIGWQQVSISVEGTRYSWQEYVCFNPYRGFFYLSEYEGHWNVIEKQRRLPERETNDSHPAVTFGGTTFKHFQTATAHTEAALGEFPWELRVGDHVVARDYVAPPLLLSAEVSGQEVTWSLGTYTPPEVIQKAFGLEKTLRSPAGVFANQPNPYGTLPKAIFGRFGLAMIALVAMFLVNVALAGDVPVFNEQYTYARTPISDAMPDSAFRAAIEPVGEAFVTKPFTLEGRPSGVTIELSAPLANDWLFFTLVLINEVTGESREVSRQLSYYSGTDSDGSWSEGSQRETVRLSGVPAGRYFLRVQPEGQPGRGAVSYRLAVRRDEPYYLLYGLAFLALLVPTIVAVLPAASFESRRWAESDHAPSTSSGGDDDD